MGWREIMGVQAKAIYPQNPQKSEPRQVFEGSESSDPAPAVHAPPDPSLAEKWRTRLRGGLQDPAQDGESVHQTRVAQWLIDNPVPSSPDRCAECGDPGSSGEALVPFGTEPHVWLHHICWRPWYDQRLIQAEAAITTAVP